MIQDYSVLGVILARGGSERIPLKNIKPLLGKPLIQYTIEAAQKSKLLDRLILSTDDESIAQVAREAGCEVPFIRPPELAADDTTDYPVFLHALKWLKDTERFEPDLIVQLRPTSPLRTAQHIDDAVRLLSEHPEADSVRTVTEPEQSPYKMFTLSKAGYLEPLLRISGQEESFNLPHAKLPKVYKHVGYVDVVWRRTLLEKGQMTGENLLPLIIAGAESGINTHDDWLRYEHLMKLHTENPDKQS